MKASDIVIQLMTRLPALTTRFSDQITINTITSSGTTATVNATAHGLSVGDRITVTGARTDAAISTLTRSGTVASATTTINHDLTYDAVQIQAEGAIYVTISGATEAEFNGTFELLSVPDSTNFTFKVPDSGATTATGSPVLENGVAFNYNGVFLVDSVIGVDDFTYILPVGDLPDASGSPMIETGYRIARAATLDRAIDSYTKQNLNSEWAFVVVDDVAASKDRHTQSDAVNIHEAENSFRQQVIYPFSVYVFSNATQDISGASIKDSMLDIQGDLFKSLIGKQFDSQLECGKLSSVSFVGHGTAIYEPPFYVHQFQFEAVADIGFKDGVGYDENVAFRDIEISQTLAFNVDGEASESGDALTLSIDLEESQDSSANVGAFKHVSESSENTVISSADVIYKLTKSTESILSVGVSQSDNQEFTVARGGFYKFSGVLVGGRASGSGSNKYLFYSLVNDSAVDIMVERNGISSNNEIIPFDVVLELEAGDRVSVGVLNDTDADNWYTRTYYARLERI